MEPIPSHMNPVHILTQFWEPCHGSVSYCWPRAETQVQTQGNPCGEQCGSRMDFSPNTALFSLLSFHQWYILMSLIFTNLPKCPDLGLSGFSKLVSLESIIMSPTKAQVSPTILKTSSSIFWSMLCSRDQAHLYVTYTCYKFNCHDNCIWLHSDKVLPQKQTVPNSLHIKFSYSCCMYFYWKV